MFHYMPKDWDKETVNMITDMEEVASHLRAESEVWFILRYPDGWGWNEAIAQIGRKPDEDGWTVNGARRETEAFMMGRRSVTPDILKRSDNAREIREVMEWIRKTLESRGWKQVASRQRDHEHRRRDHWLLFRFDKK